MTAKDFIIEQLNLISTKVKDIGLRYAFDKRSKFHIIEVSPDDIYFTDDKYRSLESDIEIEFINKFPEEDLLFSEISVLNDMTDLIHEIVPPTASDIIGRQKNRNLPKALIDIEDWIKITSNDVIMNNKQQDITFCYNESYAVAA